MKKQIVLEVHKKLLMYFFEYIKGGRERNNFKI